MSNLPNFHSSSGVDQSTHSLPNRRSRNRKRFRWTILRRSSHDDEQSKRFLLLSFFFNISDPSRLHYLTLEAQAYSHNRPTYGRSFRSKVSLPVTSFVPHSNDVVLHFPHGEPWDFLSCKRRDWFESLHTQRSIFEILCCCTHSPR